jgi:hypothetical protein
MHTYEVRPEKIIAGVNLISDILPFGRLLYLEVREAVDYAKFCSRSHDAVIRVYDAAGNVIELLYRFESRKCHRIWRRCEGKFSRALPQLTRSSTGTSFRHFRRRK